MKEYMEYYQRNKQLDKMYEEKYCSIDDKCYENNCLELIVEICELCNESKCFKYWSNNQRERDTKNIVINKRAKVNFGFSLKNL